jgi:type II secretory pathway component GspD/PulD (secretin)
MKPALFSVLTCVGLLTLQPLVFAQSPSTNGAPVSLTPPADNATIAPVLPVPGTESELRVAPTPDTLVSGMALPAGDNRLKVQVQFQGKPLVLTFNQDDLLRRVTNRRTRFEYVREPLYSVFAGLAKLMNRGFEFPYVAPTRGGDTSGQDLSMATLTARYENMTPSEVFFRVAKDYGFVVRDDDGVLRLLNPASVKKQDLVMRVYTMKYVNLYNYFDSIKAMLSPVGQIYVDDAVVQGGKGNTITPGKLFGQASAGDPSLYSSGATSSSSASGAGSPSINSDAEERDAVRPNNAFSYTVYDLPEVQEQIAAYIADVDKPHRQIQVQMRLYEYDLTRPGASNEVGLDLSSILGGYSLTAGNVKGLPGATATTAGTLGPILFPSPTTMILEAQQLQAAVHFMQTDTRSKLKESPSIIAQHGVTTFMRSVTRVPYLNSTSTNGNSGSSTSTQTINYVDIGTTLNVTPFIEDDSDPDPSQWTLYLDLKPEVTASAGTVTIAGNPTPEFTARAPTTQVRIRNGDTVLLAGFTSDDLSVTSAGVPWLKDIPILGYFFGTKSTDSEKTELVMLVTADIIDLDNKTLPAAGDRDLRQWVVEGERKGPEAVQVKSGTPVDVAMGAGPAPASTPVAASPDAANIEAERLQLEQERRKRMQELGDEFQKKQAAIDAQANGITSKPTSLDDPVVNAVPSN